MDDPFYVYRPLFDLIGLTEGTDRGRGYNETLAYGAFTGGDRDLVRMTLDQIDQLQSAMLRDPKNTMNSSALGRYQIVRTTLREIRKVLGRRGAEKFDASLQDRMACFLLGRRGIDRWIAGKMTDGAMINALALEWASLPKTNGKGAYGGQNAAVKPATVLHALSQVKQRASAKPSGKPASAQKPASTTSDTGPTYNGAPVPVPETDSSDPVIVEKPVVADPGEMATPPSKSKTVWTWLLTAIGAPIAAFGNLDWRVQLAIVAVIVGFAIYGIKRRNDLFKAVRALKAELE